MHKIVDTRTGKVLKSNMSLLEACAYLMRRRDRVASADRNSFQMRSDF